MVPATISDSNIYCRIQWSRELLGDLLDEPAVLESDLVDRFRNIAESSYNATDCYDSDYQPNGIGLMALKKPWNKKPNTREVIIDFLDALYGNCQGNLIIRQYVRDFACVVGLEDRYR